MSKNRLTSSNLLSGVLLGVGLMCASLGASAESVNLKYEGFAYGSEAARVKTKGDWFYSGVDAGGFDMSVAKSDSGQFSVGSSVLAWCVDVTQSLKTYGDTKYSVDNLDADSWFGKFGSSSVKVNNLQSLINQHYKELLEATNNLSVLSAAMQLAIWEVVADETLSLTAGKFKAQAALWNQDSAEAMRIAAEWLRNLGQTSTTGNYRIIVLNNNCFQDLIAMMESPISTPLPGAALLFLSAIGLGGIARRSRERAAA